MLLLAHGLNSETSICKLYLYLIMFDHSVLAARPSIVLHILRRCQRGARSSRAWQVVRARLDEVLRRCVVRHRGARGKHGGDPDGERCPLAYSDERRKRDRLLGILESMLTRLLELLL